MKRDEQGDWNITGGSIDEEVPATATGEQSPEQIAQDIVRTRERMSENIGALGEKLAPERLKQEAQDAITQKAHEIVADMGEQARRTGDRLVEFIKVNPLPVAAATLGALWLLTKRNRSEISGDRMARFAYTGPERRSVVGRSLAHVADRAGDVREALNEIASDANKRAGEVVEQTQERATDLATGARERIQDLGARARQQTERARRGLAERIHDNPLTATAGAALIGAALGMLLPDTAQERELMGSARDTVVDRAETTVRRVKEAAIDAGRQVSDTVQQEIVARGPGVKSALQDVADIVGQEVKESASLVAEAAKRPALE